MHEPSHRIPDRTWPGTLVIGVALALYVGGLQWWDRHTPGTRALPAGQTISMGPVRFVPAPGWHLDVGRSRAGQTLVLSKTGHSFVVRADRWLGDDEGPLERQQRKIERGERLRIDGEPAPFVTDWGLQGSTFSYYGSRVSGRLWQVVDTGRRSVVLIDFYGPNDDDAADELTEAREMLASMDLEAS